MWRERPLLFVPLLAALLVAQGAQAQFEAEQAELETELVLIVKVSGNGSDVRLEVPLPKSGGRQKVRDEEFRLRGFEMEEVERDGNRTAVLTYPKLQGRKRFTYKARIVTRSRSYAFEAPALGVAPSPKLARWVIPTPRLQARSPLVRERLIRHVEPRIEAGEKDIVQLVYGLVSRQYEPRNRKDGTSNVLKAVRTGAADALGLDRLFVTFLRAAGVPARTVTGFSLDRDGSRRLARWTEAWLSGQWIPFSVHDSWYGRIPAGMLKLQHGDRGLIVREGVAGLSYKVIVRDPRPEPGASEPEAQAEVQP